MKSRGLIDPSQDCKLKWGQSTLVPIPRCTIHTTLCCMKPLVKRTYVRTLRLSCLMAELVRCGTCCVMRLLGLLLAVCCTTSPEPRVPRSKKLYIAWYSGKKLLTWLQYQECPPRVLGTHNVQAKSKVTLCLARSSDSLEGP